jgi:hypothetical protein
VGRESQKIVI